MAAAVLGVAAAQDPVSVSEIMQKNFEATILPATVARYTFTLTDKSGSSMVRKVYSATKLLNGTHHNRRLSRFEYPIDAKGISSLIVEQETGPDDLWVYLPALKKARRLIADNKKDSFMGTDLSYADVIGYPPERWTHTLNGESAERGLPCWSITSVPKEESLREQTGYSKRESCIDEKSYVALWVTFYDLQGKAVKRVDAKIIDQVPHTPGKYVVRSLRAENLIDGHVTQITADQFSAAKALPDDAFTEAALENAQ